MPALEFVNNVVRCACHQTYGAARIINIYHVQWNGSPGDFLTTADVNAICGTVGTAHKTRFMPLLTTNMTLDSTTGQDLSGATSPSGSSGVNGAGGVTGASSTASIALCLSWKINRHYRGGHPRTYFGGVPTANLAGNQTFANTFTAAMAAAGTVFLTDIAALTIRGGNCQLVTVHRKHAGLVLKPPQVDID
jgi:hypothetical protein